jgi:DNA modification methylase
MSDVRVIHGDSLQVLPTLEAESIDSIATDPPYGIDYQSAWRTDRSAWLPKIANDREPFLAWLGEAYRLVKVGGTLACFCAWKTQEEFRSAIESVGFAVRSQVVWDRDSHGMGDLGAEFAPQHDIIWFATKGAYSFPGKRPKSVVRHQRVAPGALKHPNEKPVRLMIDLLNAITPRDSLILDPFAGSGSTLVACLKTGRRGIGIEIDARYIKTIERRLKEAETPLFTGLEAS